MTAAEIAARAELAKGLARDAGALAQRYFRREIDFVAETKSPQDFVSAADHAVEALIRERLQKAFPADAVLGEEGGASRDAISGSSTRSTARLISCMACATGASPSASSPRANAGSA